MWCPSYATLREGLDVDDDKDVVKYFQNVMKIRETARNEEFDPGEGFSCTGTLTCQLT